MNVRRSLTTLLACLVLAFPGSGGAADALPPQWPAQNVAFTVPFSKGGDADILVQLLLQPFLKATSFTLTPQYISGRAGADAWALMVDDPADGSVVTGIAIPHIILRARERDSGVSSANMGICHIFAYTPCVLWVPKDSAYTTLQAVSQAAAAARGGFLVAGPGRYSAGQAMSRIIDRASGARTTYIPYAGTVEAAQAVRAGHASAFWAHSIRPSIFSDTFVPVAVASEARVPSMPDVPTFKELGIDVSLGVFHGVAVPAETPEEIRKKIGASFASITGTKHFQDAATALGFLPLSIAYDAIPGFFSEQEAFYAHLFDDYDMDTQ